MALRRCPTCAALFGINAGVFDQNLAYSDVCLRLFIDRERGCEVLALNSGIDVTSTGELQLIKTINRSDSGNDLFRNLPGRFAQLLGQLKSERERVFAKFNARRLLDDNLRQIETVVALQKVANLLGKPAFQMTIQEFLEAADENSDCSRGRAARQFDGVGTLPYDENQSLVIGRWSFVIGQRLPRTSH